MDNQKNRYLEVNLLEKVDSTDIDLELQDGKIELKCRKEWIIKKIGT